MDQITFYCDAVLTVVNHLKYQRMKLFNILKVDDSGQWHSLTSSHLITEVKLPWSGLVHIWVTFQWKVTIHGIPSVPKIQNRSISGSILDVKCIIFTGRPAGIAQSVEHRALGHKALGSNLASASNPRSNIGQLLQQ